MNYRHIITKCRSSISTECLQILNIIHHWKAGTWTYLSTKLILILGTKISITIGVDSVIHMNHNHVVCGLAFILYMRMIACNIDMQPYRQTFGLIYQACTKTEFDIYTVRNFKSFRPQSLYSFINGNLALSLVANYS